LEITAWRRALDQKWDSLHLGGFRVNPGRDQHEVELDVFLNGIDPNAVRVQLYADPVNDEDSVSEMTRIGTSPDSSCPDVYHATISSARAIGDYTARVLPTHAGVSVPLECARVAWQR
jgi:starch phosphorylase